MHSRIGTGGGCHSGQLAVRRSAPCPQQNVAGRPLPRRGHSFSSNSGVELSVSSTPGLYRSSLLLLVPGSARSKHCSASETSAGRFPAIQKPSSRLVLHCAPGGHLGAVGPTIGLASYSKERSLGFRSGSSLRLSLRS